MVTFIEYLDHVYQSVHDNPEWRIGQAFFNGLYEVHPNLATNIWGGVLDPFHNDFYVPGFLAYVARHWEDKP